MEVLRQRWAFVLVDCRAYMARWKRGEACHRPTRVASEWLLRAEELAGTDSVITTALSVYVLQGASPGSFRSDAAFRMQLARAIVRLAPPSQTARGGTYYGDIPPRVAAVVTDHVHRSFGVAGLRIAEHEREKERKARESFDKLHEALSSLDDPRVDPVEAYARLLRQEPLITTVTRDDGSTFERRVLPDGTTMTF